MTGWKVEVIIPAIVTCIHSSYCLVEIVRKQIIINFPLNPGTNNWDNADLKRLLEIFLFMFLNICFQQLVGYSVR